MRKYLPLLSIIFILFGCGSYVMEPPPAPAVDIDSAYEEKISGKWAVVVDKSTTVFEREISSTGSMSPFDPPPVCHAYDFPFSSGNTISISVNKTLPEVFDEIVEYENNPTSSEMKQNNISGVITVKLDEFEPEWVCELYGYCRYTIFMNLVVEVQGLDEKLDNISANILRAIYDKLEGNGCQRNADMIMELYGKVLRASMEKMAKQLSNSEKIRDYSTIKQLK